MDLRLADKSVLVSGASRGIGRSIARAFLAEGARVTLTARGAKDLEAARQAFADEFGGERVKNCVADLTTTEGVALAVRCATETFGGLDVVIGNVGRGSYPGGLDRPLAEWTDALTTNLLGAMELARQTIPLLAHRESGAIVFISSIAGVEAIGAPVAYEAAKAALIAATKSLARMSGPGVRVNTVAPGNILFPGGTWERKRSENAARVQRMLDDDVALKRFGTPEEIAAAVVFLASPVSGFTTGTCLIVDGGQTRSW